MKLVRGPQGNHICTWCGVAFETRLDLLEHRMDSPSCQQNKNVLNAYQPGSHEFGERPVVPGKHTLALVEAQRDRQATEAPMPLLPGDGPADGEAPRPEAPE